jgi:hypothetical protein
MIPWAGRRACRLDRTKSIIGVPTVPPYKGSKSANGSAGKIRISGSRSSPLAAISGYTWSPIEAGLRSSPRQLNLRSRQSLRKLSQHL